MDVPASWIVWGAIFGAGLAYELHTVVNKRKGDTLSAVTRALFRVHTKPGQIVFLAVWLGGSAWYAGHILEVWK